MISVSIVEDNATTMNDLTSLLAGVPDFECVSVHRSAEDAIKSLPQHAPHIVLMDINLPRMSGIECVARLKQMLPRTHFVMFTVYEDADQIFESLRVGASGYLLKGTPLNDVIEALKEVMSGGGPLSPSVARKVIKYFGSRTSKASLNEQLSPREREVLSLLAKGFQNKEIAERLGISFGGVRNHLYSIYGKLHVQSRTEAVLKYLGGAPE